MAYTRPHEDRLGTDGSAVRVLSWTGTGTAEWIDQTGGAQFSDDAGSRLRFLSGYTSIGAFGGDPDVNFDALITAYLAGDDAIVNLNTNQTAGADAGGAQWLQRGRYVNIDAGFLEITINEAAADSKHYLIGGHGLVVPHLSADPGGGDSESGQVYFNDVSMTFRGYDGTVWGELALT